MNTQIRSFRRILFALILLLLSGSLLWAQFGGRKKPKPSKTVTGQVADQNDVPIPTAVVNLTNLQTKKVEQDVTDDKGQFRFGGLNPDIDYNLQAFYHNVKGPVERISMYDTRSKRQFYWKLPITMADAAQEVDVIFQVSDAQGHGIPGATLKFTGTKKIETLTTSANSNGRTHEWLSMADAYSIVTEASGYQTDVHEAFKPTRDTGGLQIVLKPAK